MPPVDPIEEVVESTLPRKRQVVIASVQRHLHGADGCGLLFSRGVDSTIVLCALKELGARDLRTFSFGFDRNGQKYTSDLEAASRLARHFGVRHDEVWIDATHDPLPGVLRLLTHLDEPYLTPNTYGKSLLFQCAHDRGIRLCMTGSGCAFSFERRPPDFLKKLRKRAGKSTSMENWTLQRRANFLSDEQQAVMRADSTVDAQQTCLRIVELFAEDVRSRPWGDFGDFMFDTSLRLQIGEKSAAVMDRVAMPHGVEVRHPLYDVDLHRFACTLPSAWKGSIAGSQGKYALREAFRGDLPSSVLDRNNVGFTSLYWTAANAIEPLTQRLLTREAFEHTAFFDPEAAVRLIGEDGNNSRRSAGKRTWGLLVLQAWLDTWIHGGALLKDLQPDALSLPHEHRYPAFP